MSKSVLEMLARLTPKTCSSEVVGGMHGARFSQAEFAMLLVGLPDHVCRFAEAKYMGNGNALTDLQEHVMSVAKQRNYDYGWDVRAGDGVLIRMAVLATAEAVDPMICPTCKGVGYVDNRFCRCQTGRKKLTGRYRYEFIGVGKTSWNQVWQSRYHALFLLVNDFDATLAASIAYRFYPARQVGIEM